MPEFVCPKCQRTSYSADPKSLKECPYCNPKAVVILSSIFINALKDLESRPTLFVVDRRQKDRRHKDEVLPNGRDFRTGKDRRGGANPIGWLIFSSQDEINKISIELTGSVY